MTCDLCGAYVLQTNQCPECLQHVCDGVCWNDIEAMCEDCTIDLMEAEEEAEYLDDLDEDDEESEEEEEA